MANKQPAVSRRFYKVLMRGFHPKLNLPPAISKALEKCKSGKAILESHLGRWKMGLSRNRENGLICFQKGWPEFVDGHDLSVGDFLVFEPIENHQLHFNVYVFDCSACEKQFCVQTQTEELKNHETLDSSEEEETPYFVKTISPTAFKCGNVYIPRKFMRLNNLGKQTSAALIDPKGRAWAVRLNYSQGLRMRMGNGWQDFYASNALNVGDTCVFKLNRPKLTSTTVFFQVEILGS